MSSLNYSACALSAVDGTIRTSCIHGGTGRNLRDSLSMQKREISPCAIRLAPFHRVSYMVMTRFPRDSRAPSRTSSLSPASTPLLSTRRSEMLVTCTQNAKRWRKKGHHTHVCPGKVG